MEQQKGSSLKNPNILRVSNQLQVIRALQRKPQSCSDMARSLSLSNVALMNITEELAREGFIVPHVPVSQSKVKGRKPLLYTLNVDVGVFCAIDFSGRDLQVALSDMNNAIVARGFVPNILYIDDHALAKVKDVIDELLSRPETKRRKLLGISISTPGEFDRETGNFIYAPRISNCETMNFKTYFEGIYKVNTYLYNDVNLGLVGEREFGCIPKEAKHVYFVFMDYVAGSSLLLDGKIYEGAHGYAGEPSSYAPIDSFSSSQYSGRFFTLNDIYWDLHEQANKHPEDPFYASEPFRFSEVASRFKAGDPVVVKAVEKSAKINAIQLLSVTNLLDLEYVCLEGKMLEFGPRYRELICRYYRQYDANRNTAQILFSSCGHDANLLGAIYQASNMYFLDEFVKLAGKRTNAKDNGIKDFFGKNI